MRKRTRVWGECVAKGEGGREHGRRQDSTMPKRDANDPRGGTKRSERGVARRRTAGGGAGEDRWRGGVAGGRRGVASEHRERPWAVCVCSGAGLVPWVVPWSSATVGHTHQRHRLRRHRRMQSARHGRWRWEGRGRSAASAPKSREGRLRGEEVVRGRGGGVRRRGECERRALVFSEASERTQGQGGSEPRVRRGSAAPREHSPPLPLRLRAPSPPWMLVDGCGRMGTERHSPAHSLRAASPTRMPPLRPGAPTATACCCCCCCLGLLTAFGSSSRGLNTQIFVSRPPGSRLEMKYVPPRPSSTSSGVVPAARAAEASAAMSTTAAECGVP